MAALVSGSLRLELHWLPSSCRPLLCTSWAAKEGLGAPLSFSTRQLQPWCLCPWNLHGETRICGISDLRVKLAFLHCVVLTGGREGGGCSRVDCLGSSEGHPPLPPGRARVCFFCAAYTCEWGSGIGNFTFSLQETLKQLKVVPLVSVFNSAGEQMKLTFFLYISS